MTSPFEDAGTVDNLSGMPVRLLNSDLGRKEVARLEFHTIDQPKAQSVQDRELDPAQATEALLREQIAGLEETINLQTNRIAAQTEAAKREAQAESRAAWESELEEQIARERSHVVRILEQFRKERSRYFSGVEAEVVKLALAIAARVLHREVKLDPLLLRAAVRIALEKVADNSTSKLRVPASDIEDWRKIFTSEMSCELELIGEDQLSSGECILETDVGRVDLGVRAQLEEIERGFFDLLQQRPS